MELLVSFCQQELNGSYWPVSDLAEKNRLGEMTALSSPV